jgi:hypothetical protein
MMTVIPGDDIRRPVWSSAMRLDLPHGPVILPVTIRHVVSSQRSGIDCQDLATAHC